MQIEDERRVITICTARSEVEHISKHIRSMIPLRNSCPCSEHLM